MAGGLVKYRHLSRNSAHRQALLRNLVTSLVKHESIRTTWAKAKETQRMADKLITLAKRNNETARRKAHGVLFVRYPLHSVSRGLYSRYQSLGFEERCPTAEEEEQAGATRGARQE